MNDVHTLAHGPELRFAHHPGTRTAGADRVLDGIIRMSVTVLVSPKSWTEWDADWDVRMRIRSALFVEECDVHCLSLSAVCREILE